MSYSIQVLSGEDSAPALSDQQAHILQRLGISAATISVIFALVSFYWFLKMRRSFRHDLIMLLIQSDMFRALWYIIYPLASYMHGGPFPSSSKFCQISGFFSELGPESGDVAIFLISIHTALYVFGPRKNSWDGGLYPYRHIAYACWLGLPLLAASLVYINHGSYVSQGNACYLPIRPFWYRLALSWIPRYTIFITILGLYTAIYFYVNRKLHGFRRELAEDLDPWKPFIQQDDRPLYVSHHRESVPPVPPLNLNGLLPDSRPASMVEPTDFRTLESWKSLVRSPMSPKQWAVPTQTKSEPSDSQSEVIATPEPRSSETDSFLGPSVPKPNPSFVMSSRESLPPESLQSAVPTLSRQSSWRDTFVHRFSPYQSCKSKTSHVNIMKMLQERSEGDDSSTPIPRLRLTNTRGEDFEDLDLIRTRDKFRRHLRYIFLYPLAYMVMWTLPFIYHILQYNDKLALHPPFGLRVAVTLIMCLQAAVDCLLFASREKPWKHMPGHDGTFLGSLKFWQGWSELRKRSAMLRHGPGKTREEMHREAALAYGRRKEEIAERRKSILSRVDPATHQEQHQKYWWNDTQSGAAMSFSLAYHAELEEPLECRVQAGMDYGLTSASASAPAAADVQNASAEGAQV